MALSTPRLLLREITESDTAAIASILQDDETMHAYNGAFTDAQVDTWLERNAERYASDGVGLWAVELGGTGTGSGTVIGQCGLTWQEINGARVREVGYLFNRAAWHHGYATEAAAACVAYAFNQLGEQRVYAQVRDTNLASMNVAIRLGMTVRSRFVKHYRNTEMPHLAFAIDRDTWLRSQHAS